MTAWLSFHLQACPTLLRSPGVSRLLQVVFLLVDAWKQVGQDLMPYLKDLSTSQQKLVAIYIDRANQQQM